MDTLVWFDAYGMGMHTRPPISYAGSYWDNYRQLDATPMGEALTAARAALVRRHAPSLDPATLVDVGIGGGRFVEEMGCMGCDVNPEAVAWLGARYSYLDPLRHPVEALTFWDSLEHIPDPVAIVSQARRWVFVSMPIYCSMEGVLNSPHYKPGEHLWYWTQAGLVDWFGRLGFVLRESNAQETALGRRGIISFAFERET